MGGRRTDGRPGAAPRGAAGTRVLLPPLVVAFLLCHGVFGGLHLPQGVSRGDPAASHQAPGGAGGAASAHGLLGHAGGDPSGDLGDAAAGDCPLFPACGYAAVLLAALLGAVFLGRLGRVPARTTGLAPWAPLRRPLGGARPFLGRGPAPPFLQVFRL